MIRERNKVVLVDQKDNSLGKMDRLKAHEQGKLHRAFSIFIFNDNQELLLQQRASNKYHGANLWTNTCCSHPQLHEDLKFSALERLNYEMGIECDIEWIYSFIYNEKVENNLTEHEFDHVFVGFYNQNPIINALEVNDYKWMNTSEIVEDIKSNPFLYTVWFKEAFPEVIRNIKAY